MPYQDCKIYGPYQAKDKRLRIVCIFPNGRQVTVSYPKFLVEQLLGRFLLSNETVHHLDSDPMNNKIENLKVMSRADHARQDNYKLEPQEFICPNCKSKFILKGRRLYDALYNRRRKDCKTYCCKSCAGIHTYINPRICSPRLSLNEETH